MSSTCGPPSSGRTPLPESVELYDLAQDSSEKNNLAADNPDKVAALRKRAHELARGMAKSPLPQTEVQALRVRLAMPPALPNEELDFHEEP